MVPLFLPGGPELIVILFMLAFYLGVPILVIVAIYNFLDGRRGYEKRITALEQAVEELKDEQS